jgi:hypothetical protein
MSPHAYVYAVLHRSLLWKRQWVMYFYVYGFSLSFVFIWFVTWVCSVCKNSHHSSLRLFFCDGRQHWPVRIFSQPWDGFHAYPFSICSYYYICTHCSLICCWKHFFFLVCRHVPQLINTLFVHIGVPYFKQAIGELLVTFVRQSNFYVFRECWKIKC